MNFSDEYIRLYVYFRDASVKKQILFGHRTSVGTGVSYQGVHRDLIFRADVNYIHEIHKMVIAQRLPVVVILVDDLAEPVSCAFTATKKYQDADGKRLLRSQEQTGSGQRLKKLVP